jgi:predicted nucleic acid-binding protein
MTPKIYLDTNMFIEALEQQNGTAASAAQAVLAMVDNGEIIAVISELVIAELLVKPFQLGDERLADAYAALFELQIGYTTCAVSRDVLIEAARQRAIYPTTKLPDAIHIATARLQKCPVFLTTETRLRMPHHLIRLGLDGATASHLRSLA